MSVAEIAAGIIKKDPWRMQVLEAAAKLDLDDWAIGGGFVRNAIWDHIHAFERTPLNDVDLVYFDSRACTPQRDESIRLCLESEKHGLPDVPWDVSNQARAHKFYGRAKFKSVADSMRYWPETASAVIAKLTPNGKVVVESAYGFVDLFAGTIRPTFPSYVSLVVQRAAEKGWLGHWNELRLCFLERHNG